MWDNPDQRLPQHLRFRVPEYTLRTRIPQGDPHLRINGYHSIHRGGDKLTVSFLTLPQCLRRQSTLNELLS